MTWVCAVLTAAVAILDWTAVARGSRGVERWAKPLTLVTLLATVISAGALHESPGRWLVVALVGGLAGDVALLDDSERRLLTGVAAFFVGHLAYLAAFVALGLPAPAWWWLVVAVLAAVGYPTRAVLPAAWRRGGAPLAVPLAAYTLVIAAMTVAGFLTGVPVIALGATLFVLSDSLIALGLARHDFRQAPGGAHLAVMVTYHASQALLAAGVLTA